MRVRVIFLLLVLIAIALFTAANWTAFTTPTTLSLVATTIEAPLGLIMLGLMALLTGIFLVVVGFLQSSALMEMRQHAREIRAQRELADKAEASRFSELRALLESRLLQAEQGTSHGQAQVLARMDQLDKDLRLAIEQAGNTLAAYIGELEDRMEGTAQPGRGRESTQ
jgi:uncharacterized integral membrane protein